MQTVTSDIPASTRLPHTPVKGLCRVYQEDYQNASPCTDPFQGLGEHAPRRRGLESSMGSGQFMG